MKIKKSVALVSILSLLTLAGCGESAGNSSSSNSSSSSQNTSSASNINSSTASNSSTSSSSESSVANSTSSSSNLDSSTSSSPISSSTISSSSSEVSSSSSSLSSSSSNTSSSSSSSSSGSSSSSSTSTSSSSSSSSSSSTSSSSSSSSSSENSTSSSDSTTSSSSSSSQETKPELPDFSKLTAEELYVYALNEYLNGNYYSYQTGNTNCKSKLIKISQKVVSYKIKDNNTMFFETYTVTNNVLIKVNIAQQRLENNVDDIHAYRSSSSGVSVSTDDSGNHDGSANFGDGLTKQTAEEYTNTFGHSMFGIVSYDVTAENYSQSIVSSSKNEAADGEYSYNYVVSLSDSDTTINASKGYAVEMHQISGYAPTFKSANFTVTVNADGSIKSISVNEQYQIKVLGLKYNCTSVFTTYFTKLNTISDAPEAKLNNYYSALENYNSAE